MKVLSEESDMVVFGIILVSVVFFVVFKVLISEAKPYKAFEYGICCGREEGAG